MLATITHSDSGKLVWSPQGDKLAYVTMQGLQVYLMHPRTETEHYLHLAEGAFREVFWSPTARYLTAENCDGTWTVYTFVGATARVIFSVAASTLEWVDNDQVVYVPEDGGLVLVYLGDPVRQVRLAG